MQLLSSSLHVTGVHSTADRSEEPLDLPQPLCVIIMPIGMGYGRDIWRAGRQCHVA